jgi:hypothetical protein
MRIELDSSNWAEVKEIDELRNADRKAVNRATSVNYDDTGGHLMLASVESDRYEALAARVVTEWSLPLKLPGRDKSVFDELTLEQEQHLREKLRGHMAVIDERTEPGRPGTGPTSA